MRKTDGYRAELATTLDLDVYLRERSGLPGPRANLELVQAVADRGDVNLFRRLSASADEYLALCGVVGLGAVAAPEDLAALDELRVFAADPRWRVREGVAMALQRIGARDMSAVLAGLDAWVTGDPFELRAAAAGVCEPVLLRRSDHAVAALELLDRITTLLATTGERSTEGFRVLRQALGYCWSVAAAAAPEAARPLLERWMASPDQDVRWIMRENLRKARMNHLGAEWVARWQSALKP